MKLSKRPSLKQPVPLLKELPFHKTTVREDASKSSTHSGGGTVSKNKLPLKNYGRPVCSRLKFLNQYLANITEQELRKPSDIPMPGGWGKSEYSQG